MPLIFRWVFHPALEWVLPYATGERNYSKPEVTPFDHGKFFQVLRVASRVWPDGAARYEAVITRLKPGKVDYDGSALNLLWPRVGSTLGRLVAHARASTSSVPR